MRKWLPAMSWKKKLLETEIASSEEAVDNAAKDGFIGNIEIENREYTFHSVFEYARKIRDLLGEQGYLLDHYLSLFFEALQKLSVLEAVETGVSMPCDYHELCRNMLADPETVKKNPLSDTVSEKLNSDAKVGSYLEQRTRIDLLYTLTADEFLQDAAEKFIEEQRNNVACTLDEIYYKRLYERIADVVGEDMMDELNKQLKEKFLVSTVYAVFVQSFTADLIGRLAERDIQMGKRIFQLIMGLDRQFYIRSKLIQPEETVQFPLWNLHCFLLDAEPA